MTLSAITLFILGMPRSGTKLLRDLLNNHSKIAIFPHETHFFPALEKRLVRFGDLQERENFDKLYAHLTRSVFFRRMNARGIEISADDWFNSLQGTDFPGVINGLFACYRQLTRCEIVGDKTPSYITHLPLLARNVPDSRFIHIIRDPRDYALSIRRAWNKHLPRAALRWKQGVRQCQSDAATHGAQYMEVKYEDLLTDPERVLTKICTFLHITFESNMTTLAKPAENIGSARGATRIVQDNLQKWRTDLKSDEIAKIESIAGHLMIELGYRVETQAGDDSLSAVEMAIGKIHDQLSLLRFAIRQEGSVIGALKHSARVLRYR